LKGEFSHQSDIGLLRMQSMASNGFLIREREEALSNLFSSGLTFHEHQPCVSWFKHPSQHEID
jgi:hypothetical protein